MTFTIIIEDAIRDRNVKRFHSTSKKEEYFLFFYFLESRTERSYASIISTLPGSTAFNR